MGENSTVAKRQFKEGFDKLQECFPNSAVVNSDTIMRYWEYLSGEFTEKEFKDTIEKIIVSERFFPTISVFFEHKEQSLSKKAF